VHERTTLPRHMTETSPATLVTSHMLLSGSNRTGQKKDERSVCLSLPLFGMVSHCKVAAGTPFANWKKLFRAMFERGARKTTFRLSTIFIYTHTLRYNTNTSCRARCVTSTESPWPPTAPTQSGCARSTPPLPSLPPDDGQAFGRR
jgi:hypothetical protein